jgi:hypothetical protein
MPVDLGEERTVSRLAISEAYDRIQRFELQRKAGDKWETFFKGKTVGTDYSATFKPVTARHIRLAILEATDVPTIWDVALFEK